MSGKGKVVCVTGGSGYIASWLIKHLLHRGYTVKATVRNPSDPKRTAHLLELDGAKERLHLFKASLLEEGSFDPVVDGCEAVFHTASPVTFGVSDPMAELVEPAVKGTINVLKSCAKAKCIKRVIFTSSIASVFLDSNQPDPSVEVDETWFSDPKLCEEMKLWYPLGKTLAEKAAREFAKENKIDLVIVNPGYVVGPMLQPTVNFSLEFLLDVLKGETYPNAYCGAVDVRDVADAHIKALENPSATGRYLLVADTKHFSEVVKIVKQQFPNIQVPQKCVDVDNNGPFLPYQKVSKKRAMSIGINFMPFEKSLKDTIQYLAQRNLINI